MESPQKSGRVEILDGGKLRVAPAFAELLRANQLDTFDRIMALPAHNPIRSFPGRNTIQLELKLPGGAKSVLFLKRYERSYLSPVKFLLRLFRWPGAGDEALREWENIQSLRADGIGTALPVASGGEKKMGVVTRSFVMTAGVEGDCAHYCVPTFNKTRRRAFARELGALARRFHAAGYVHKDFYLYHVFVLAAATDSLKSGLVLIDLQRVICPKLFHERWRVKDLAALAYSAIKIGMRRTDLMRFFKIYRGGARLSAADKLLVRKTLQRTRWLNQRTPRHDRI